MQETRRDGTGIGSSSGYKVETRAINYYGIGSSFGYKVETRAIIKKTDGIGSSYEYKVEICARN